MRKDKIIEVIKFIIYNMVIGRYDIIESNDIKKSITAETIASLIDDYGGTVNIPPDSAYEQYMRIYITEENKEASIDFDLWINDERSDLTLQCDISNDNETYKYSVYDLHVL